MLPCIGSRRARHHRAEAQGHNWPQPTRGNHALNVDMHQHASRDPHNTSSQQTCHNSARTHRRSNTLRKGRQGKAKAEHMAKEPAELGKGTGHRPQAREKEQGHRLTTEAQHLHAAKQGTKVHTPSRRSGLSCYKQPCNKEAEPANSKATRGPQPCSPSAVKPCSEQPTSQTATTTLESSSLRRVDVQRPVKRQKWPPGWSATLSTSQPASQAAPDGPMGRGKLHTSRC